jgi:hypothetical protein
MIPQRAPSSTSNDRAHASDAAGRLQQQRNWRQKRRVSPGWFVEASWAFQLSGIGELLRIARPGRPSTRARPSTPEECFYGQ